MPKLLEDGKYYYLSEVSEEAERPVSTIRRWIREGKVVYEKKYEASTGKLLFSPEELEAIVSFTNGIRS